MRQSSVSCDDGYVDCGPLAATVTTANRGSEIPTTESQKNSTDRPKTLPPESHHRKISTESRNNNIAERRESEPLLSKSASGHVENSMEDFTSHGVVEDIADDYRVVVPAGTVYQCLSRSCSIGSQLSAAASSTIHEESFSDLTLETAGTSPHADYLPMSRVSLPSKDDVINKDGSFIVASSTTTKSTASNEEKLPLVAGTRFYHGDASSNYVSPSLSRFSANPSSIKCASSSEEKLPLVAGAVPHSDATANYVLPSATRFSSNPTTVRPLPMSAGCGNTRQRSDVDDGYLQFRSIPATPPSDDDDDCIGSLERLGPPPEVPMSSVAQSDYIVPVRPPKQNPSPGQRTNSQLLGGIPATIVDRRRGSADSRLSGPLQENPHISPSLAGFSGASASLSKRPASERRAVRPKPNLTVDTVASANLVHMGEFCKQSVRVTALRAKLLFG